jgi:hypothetical protein
MEPTWNKTAIVDIDNTLWQFCDAFYEELRKINRDFPAPEKAGEQGALATGLLFPWNRAYSENGFRLCNNLDEILEGILKP